jgi:hypothetical protein
MVNLVFQIYVAHCSLYYIHLLYITSGSWCHFRLQVIGCHCIDRLFIIFILRLMTPVWIKLGITYHTINC